MTRCRLFSQLVSNYDDYFDVLSRQIDRNKCTLQLFFTVQQRKLCPCPRVHVLTDFILEYEELVLTQLGENVIKTIID